jgi:hypothetical protein
VDLAEMIGGVRALPARTTRACACPATVRQLADVSDNVYYRKWSRQRSFVSDLVQVYSRGFLKNDPTAQKMPIDAYIGTCKMMETYWKETARDLHHVGVTRRLCA